VRLIRVARRFVVARNPGVAIDLVLDRAREHRSQLVFTRIQGEARPLAEEWTFRFLGAALAFVTAEREGSDPA
jgi:hypothetical protein